MRDRTLRIVLLMTGLVALSGAGCDGDPSTDAGTDAGSADGGGTDAGPLPALNLPPLEAFVESTEEFVEATLDHSCLGTGTRPEAGADVDVRFELRDFQDDFAVDDVDVWLFRDNEIGDTCDAPTCAQLTTDTAGNAMVTMPADGWYAYRVFPREGATRGETVFGVFQYNEPAPSVSGQAVQGNSVSGTTIEIIPALLGISREPGSAIVSGRIHDCADAFIQNAVMRLYDPDGRLVEQGTRSTEPSYHYFNGNASDNLPDQERQQSNSDGLYVIVQVPIVDERPYRMEAWATIDGVDTMIGCESARIFPDAVTILNLGPLRADSPASCM